MSDSEDEECFNSDNTSSLADDDDDDDEAYTLSLSKQLVPKISGRKKNVSHAIWISSGSFAGMAEVTKVTGKLLCNTGIVRSGRVLLHLEEIGYLMQREALRVYNKDCIMSVMQIYSHIANGQYGCNWDSFKVYLELKNLGYILARHRVPWTIPSTNKRHDDELSTCLSLLSLTGGKEDSLSCPNSVNDFHTTARKDIDIQYDVFDPNSKFKKKDPGVPKFSLCISSTSPPSLADIEDLNTRNGEIPVTVASVDCGRVTFCQFNEVQLDTLP